MENSWELEFSHTNESLTAIVSGMELDRNDIVFTIASSGDQGLAILQFAKEVRIGDKNPVQLDLVRERKVLIERGDYEGFLRIDRLGAVDGAYDGMGEGSFEKNKLRCIEYRLRKREEYFTPERLDIIREKLGSLIILGQGDAIDAIRGEKDLAKIYLSDIGVEPPELEGVAQSLPAGGLIYVTDGDYFRYVLKAKQRMISSTLMLDRRLTKIAIGYQRKMEYSIGYIPVVYRKVLASNPVSATQSRISRLSRPGHKSQPRR